MKIVRDVAYKRIRKRVEYKRYHDSQRDKVSTKANHLAYLGDATIGADVNVGAGTITCNYDGVNKHETRVGDGAFIGTNASLVAPVEIGAGSTVGAGSTITKNVEREVLAVTRGKQVAVSNWRRPTKTVKQTSEDS